MKEALLVVDMQNQLIEEGPYQLIQMVEGIQKLIANFRETKQPVIFVRHNGLGLPLGSRDWEIYPSLSPQKGEKIIDKTFNSAFKKTDLKEYIDNQAIIQLVIVGMQTEYCIDATVKSAFDLDIPVILPIGLTSTFDNSLMSAQTLIAHYSDIWQGRFAQLLSLEDLIK
ncbi:Isochorismatase [Streptococcus parauberis]|nr:Isochorismatase [Streptococcus parauberis]